MKGKIIFNSPIENYLLNNKKLTIDEKNKILENYCKTNNIFLIENNKFLEKIIEEIHHLSDLNYEKINLLQLSEKFNNYQSTINDVQILLLMHYKTINNQDPISIYFFYSKINSKNNIKIDFLADNSLNEDQKKFLTKCNRTIKILFSYLLNIKKIELRGCNNSHNLPIIPHNFLLLKFLYFINSKNINSLVYNKKISLANINILKKFKIKLIENLRTENAILNQKNYNIIIYFLEYILTNDENIDFKKIYNGNIEDYYTLILIFNLEDNFKNYLIFIKKLLTKKNIKQLKSILPFTDLVTLKSIKNSNQTKVIKYLTTKELFYFFVYWNNTEYNS